MKTMKKLGLILSAIVFCLGIFVVSGNAQYRNDRRQENNSRRNDRTDYSRNRYNQRNRRYSQRERYRRLEQQKWYNNSRTYKTYPRDNRRNDRQRDRYRRNYRRDRRNW